MQELIDYELYTEELKTLADDPVDIVRYEQELYGEPTSIAPNAKGRYIVLELDTRYSPRLYLYSVATGCKGQMKILKRTFQNNPVKKGDWIALRKWTPKEAYGKPGVMEMWIDSYDRLQM